jgi:predicted enzyme related to lactoylglutathione lyase
MPKQLKASLAFLNFPSDNPSETRKFFQDLFGIDLIPSLSDQEVYHAPVSDDGIDLNIGARHTPQESPTAFIAVDDLDAALSLAQNAGGNVVWGPEDMPIPDADFEDYKKAVKEIDNVNVKTKSLGRAAVIVESGGSQVGLVEVADHAEKHFNAGKHKTPLSDRRVMAHDRSGKIAKAHGRG